MGEWEDHVEAWSHPPIDDVGYFASEDLLDLPDQELRQIIEGMRITRYTGWRNHKNLWRSQLGLDSTVGKDVMDFGCGVGVEALEFALHGNRVKLADISKPNLQLAERVLHLFNVGPEAMLEVSDKEPFVEAEPESLDVFYCNGVLHHIRWPEKILRRAHELLRPGGEVRLMVYSDTGWRQATGTEPPENTESHPLFQKFVRHFDAVGEYADWYNREKLEGMAGALQVETVKHITNDDRYLAAVLKKED